MWLVSLTSVLLLGALAGFIHDRQQDDLMRSRLALADLQGQRPSVDRAGALEAESPGDFTQALSGDAGMAAWVRDLQSEAARAGVTLVSLSDTPHAASTDRLGRHDISLGVRGAYPQIKRLLKETLDRHPHTTVARLSLRRLNDTGEVEASVMLTRWSRPAMASPSSPMPPAGASR